MKLRDLVEAKAKAEMEKSYFSYDNDDWNTFRRFVESIPEGGKKKVVLRATVDGFGGQNGSQNYKATYFTPSLNYVQDYVGEGGYIGAYVLNHTDKFIDLRYMEESDGEEEFYDYDEEDADEPAQSEFQSVQEKKLLALAGEFYKKTEDEVTLGDVYDMLEDPSPEFVQLLRSRGYYGMLTSESRYSYPVYAVFNEHVKDCIKLVPFKRPNY